MKTKIILMSLFFAAALHAEDLMVERFGMSRAEPVYTGYVFINGRYLDAPYIVEQRGVGLFINGHRFDTVNLIFRGQTTPPV